MRRVAVAVVLVTLTAVFFTPGYSPGATAVTIARHASANGQPRGLDTTLLYLSLTVFLSAARIEPLATLCTLDLANTSVLGRSPTLN